MADPQSLLLVIAQATAEPITGPEPGPITLLPPLIAIGSALLLRQVLPALFLGVWVGAWLLAGANWTDVFPSLFRSVDTYTLKAFTNVDNASVILFTFLIGGMVGIINASGGLSGLVTLMARVAGSVRRVQLSSAGLGIAIFFDDYANTLVVGNTMRPMADRAGISRAKLAYIVDSTAAPVACVALITTWIGYEVGLIDAAIKDLPGLDQPYLIYLQSLAYSFYPFLALAFVFMITGSGRDFGPMLTAERQARLASREHVEDDSDPAGIAPASKALLAFVPIAGMVLGVFSGLLLTGEGDSLRAVIGSADSYLAIIWGAVIGIGLAAGLAIATRALALEAVLHAWLDGMREMLMPIMILVLAWALAQVTEDLESAQYLVGLAEGRFPPALLPSLVFVLAAITAFSTGASWGAMGVLMPLVVPVSWALLSGDAGISEENMPIFVASIASVLCGSVWGDHCSPIADTTILSSLATKCDVMDHFRTQFPYALIVGIVAVLFGTLPVGFGVAWWICLPVAAAVLYGLLRVLGKVVSPADRLEFTGTPGQASTSVESP